MEKIKMSWDKLIKDVKQDAINSLDPAIKESIDIIISELPKGNNSSIAKDLWFEPVSDTEYDIIITNPVWSYLNYGTGIYNPDHAGQGEGGAIIPINAKALHFKNINIAIALGFPDENVFLKKVKGIKPRYFFERMYDTNKFRELLDKNMG